MSSYTFNFNMKKFIYKTTVFSTIISSIVIMTNYFGDAGNLFSKSYELEIVEMLKFNNVENVSNYDERVFQRELINSLEIKPEVIALGSSRVMTIDSDFFNDQIFINNGVSGSSIEDLIAIYQMYKSKDMLPKEIILGVDPWLFNINNDQNRWLSIEKEYNKYYNKAESKINPSFTILKYTQLFSPSYLQASIKSLQRKKITPTSKKNNEGMTLLKDGSITYGEKVRKITKDKVDYAARYYIQSKIYSIEEFKRISPEKFTEFQNLCSDILENDIKLSFFLSPYHPLVYQKISQDYDVVLDVEKEIVEFAINKKIKLIGSFSPLKAGVNYKDFFDGMHLHKSSVKLFNFN